MKQKKSSLWRKMIMNKFPIAGFYEIRLFANGMQYNYSMHTGINTRHLNSWIVLTDSTIQMIGTFGFLHHNSVFSRDQFTSFTLSRSFLFGYRLVLHSCYGGKICLYCFRKQNIFPISFELNSPKSINANVQGDRASTVE